MNLFLYGLSLFFIVLLSAYWIIFSRHNKKRCETFVDLSNPDPTNVKDIQNTPDTEKLIILSEIYSSVKNHETLINIFDDNYKITDIKLNNQTDIKGNIQNILTVLKKQDNKINDMLNGNYISSKTLNKLMDGSLLTPLISDLKKIQNIPKKDDPELMDYQHLLYVYSLNPYDDLLKTKIQQKERELNISPTAIQTTNNDIPWYDNNDDMKAQINQKASQLKVNSLTKKIENTPLVDTNPLITDEMINSRVETATLFYIVKIVEYHEHYLNIISETHVNKFKKMYNITTE